MVEFEREFQDSNILRSASVGAILGSIVSIILFCHLVYNYRAMFKRDPTVSPNSKRKTPNKTAYILVLIYVILGLVQVLSLLFIRTNIITRIRPEDFTIYQCATGFILNWFGSFGSVSMLYVIFAHRIYIVFKGSIYEYKKYIFIILYIIIAIFFCLMAVLRIVGYLSESVWALASDKGHHVIYCRNKVTHSLGPVGIFMAVYIASMSVILLYMFSSKLVHFQRERTQYFIDSHRGSSLAACVEMGYLATDKNGNFSLDAVYDTMRRRDTEAKKVMKQDIKIIFDLIDLVKKQTILATIATLSSVSLWSLTAWQNHYFWEIVWDVAINTACVWLMLKSSKKYWFWCTKYGICWPCYYKENQALPG